MTTRSGLKMAEVTAPPLIIEVPSLPDIRTGLQRRYCNPHYVTKLRNEYKHDVYFCAIAALAEWARANGHGGRPQSWEKPERARVTITFVYACKRRRDQTNLLAMWKGGEDMLVTAGILVDDDLDHLETMVPRVVVDKARAPMTIIEIERLEGDHGEVPQEDGGC